MIGVEMTTLRSPCPGARSHSQVVDAEHKIGGDERARDVVAVPEPKEGERREMRTRRLPADHKARAAELRSGVLDEPKGRDLTVVGTRWEGMLRRQSVLDADDSRVNGVGQRGEKHVLLVGRPEGPTTSVHVEVDPVDAVGH